MQVLLEKKRFFYILEKQLLFLYYWLNHIYYFVEYLNFPSLIAYDSSAADAVVTIATDFTPDSQLVKKDYTFNNKGLVFTGQGQVLDVAGNINQTESWKKQKTRQLDFSPLGSTSVNIEFLSNRFQSEQFERPDTKATLTINL